MFRETITSLRDKNYGTVIIKKPLSIALWYWTKYYLLITVVTALIFLAGITYFVPQLPKFLRQVIPDASFSVSDGHFSTSLQQPAVLGIPEFPFIIDTMATNSSQLDSTSAGILITSDNVIIKQDPNTIDTQSLAHFPNFSFEKNALINWISAHQTQVWLWAVLGLVVISAGISLAIWVSRLLGFLLWGLGFYLLARILKYSLTYIQALNLVLYASVLPLLLSFILFLFPGQVLSLINLFAFLYFGIQWLLQLPKSGSSPPSDTSPAPALLPEKQKKATRHRSRSK